MRRATSRLALVMASVAVLVLSSCGDTTVYDHYEHARRDGWSKNDTLTFIVPPLGGDRDCNVDVCLRTASDYPFTSLTLKIDADVYATHHEKAPKHLVIVSKRKKEAATRRQSASYTVSCRLVDGRGHPVGDGVTLYQYGTRVGELGLRRGDSLVFKVRHDMKREVLAGVKDVGIRIY